MIYGILAVILVAMGIFMLGKPEGFYRITEGWKHDGDAEPSKTYLFGTRFGGGMCILAGVAGIIALLLSR